MFRGKDYKILNKMIDDAIAGEYEADNYDETELSKIQNKWKRYIDLQEQERQRAKEERDSLKELITNLSHQTKTPLTNIRLYGELLEERLEEPENQNYMTEILSHTQKLEQIMNALVKMSRMETGMFQFTIQENKLLKLQQELLDTGIAIAQRKNIKILAKNDDKFINASAFYDEKWTFEAMSNILDNGIKYSKEGTVLQTGIFETEMFAGLWIKDQGPGIPEEEIPRIFSRFYRGKDAYCQDGIGVGLFLSREIIEEQRGYIRVKSEVGKGSEFWIYLPKQKK